MTISSMLLEVNTVVIHIWGVAKLQEIET